MANYNINVKAKVDVQQIKSSIKQSLADTTIRVAPKFDVFANDSNIADFRKAVAKILNAEPISITLTEPTNDNISKILGEINKKFIITPTLKFDTNKSSEFATQLNTIKQNIDEFGKNSKAKLSFDVDSESYNQLFKVIDNIKEEQKKISNLNISLGFNQKEKERLSDEITAIYALLKGLNNLGNSIAVTEPNTENLSNIKNKIQQYFQDNPIALTISENTEGIDFAELSKQYQAELAIINEKKQEKIQAEREISVEQTKIIQENVQKQEEAAEKTNQAWKNQIYDLIQGLENGKQSLKEFDSGIESIKLFSENSGADIQKYFDEASQVRDDYLKKTEDAYLNTSSNLDNIRNEIKTSYIDQQAEITDVSIQESNRRIKQQQEEAEKEENILQEQAHTRSEMRSSIFSDYDEIINYSKQILNNIQQEFETNLHFSKVVQENTDEITKILDKAFNEDIRNIFRNYQRHTADFEAYNDDFWKRVKLASEQGVSEEVIQKSVDKWNKIADAHQKSVDKINQQQEQANLKAEQERQKEEQRIIKYLEDTRNKILKEQQEEEKQREQAWNKETQDLQEKYNKQLISTEEYIKKMEILVGQGFDNGYDKANHYSNSLEQVKKKQEEAGQSADNLGNKVNSLGSKFDNVFNSLMRYFGVTKIFDAAQSSFSKMIQEVRDLDVELTEFSKVTDLTSEQTNKFIDDAYRLGETVARTGTEVVQATTLFKKMGYEIDESMQFAKDALMWTNVADGIVGVENATNMLISTMKAFEQQGISSTHIIDALNEVSNNYSTSSSALSDNLSTIAATLAVSGTSFEQTVGLMTAGIEIMPDKASKVANGLKTISQRIRQIDGDTADKLDEFLGEHGLSRFDEITGELKGTYDILEEISGIWDELSVNQRQYIGEVMAGKNQITVLNALMMNFSTAINATGTAMNSAGSAARENERVLDSIQGHIQRFQSAFEELAKNLINSEVFKQIVDFGTNLIKILNTITGNTVTLGATIASALGIVGVQSIKKLDNAFISAQKEAKKAKEAFDYANKIDWITGTISPLTAVISTIGVLTTAVTIYKQAWENAQEAERKQVQESINNRNQEIDKIKQLKKLEEEYLNTKDLEKREILYKKIYDLKIEVANLDVDGLSRHELLSNEIGKQNKLYSEQLAKLAKINLELIKRQQYEETHNKGFWGEAPIANWFGSNLPIYRAENAPKELDYYNQDYFGGQQYREFLDNTNISIQSKIDSLQQLESHFIDMIDSHEPGTEYYELYRRLYQYVLEDLKTLQENNETITSEAKIAAEEALGDLSSYTEEQLYALSQLSDSISTGSIDDISKALLELEDAFDMDIQDEFVQNILNALKNPNIAQAANDIIYEFQRIKEEAKKSSEDIEYSYSSAMGNMLSILTETTTGIQEQYDALAQAVDEFNQSGVITKETLQSLTENDLIQYLDIVNGELVINTDAFYNATEATLQKASADIDAKLEADLLALANSKVKDTLNDLSVPTNNASAGIGTVTNAATQATAALIEDAGAALEAEASYVALSNALGKELNSSNFDLQGYLSEAQQLINNAQQLKNALGNFTPTVNRGASSSRTSSSSGSGSSSRSSSSSSSSSSRPSSSSTKSSEDLWKKEFEKQQKILKHYLEMEEITERQYYASLKILNDQFFKDRVEYEEEYLKYQEEIYKGEKKFVQRIFEQTETILENQLEASMITGKQYFDKLEDLYTTYYTKQEDLEEKLFELKKQRYQYEKQQLEDQISLIESRMSKLLQRGEGLLKHRLAMDEINQSQYLDELEALYLSYYESREELEEKLWSIEESRYEERKEKLDTVISYAISVIDEEIDKLKKEKESIDEVNDSIEEQIKLQELQDNLEKARNRKIRVYRKGQGFVYEQDTQAISEAQTALDEYKRELSHKKKISMIDEEIENLEKYKEKWQSITDNYTKSQNEMVVKGILGENARQKILEDEKSYAESLGNQYVDTKDKVSDAQTGMTSDAQEGLSAREELYTTEKLIVDSIGDKYWETRGKAKDANDAIITDLGLFIGSEDDPNSLSGKIKIINDELTKVGDATITVEIDGNKYIQTVQSIEDLGLVIDDLRGKEYTELTIDINGTEYELSKQEIKVIHDAIDNLQGKTLIIKIDDQTKESLSDIQHTVDSLEGKILQIGIQNNISDDDITAIQALLNKLKNKVIEVSLQDTISDTELEDIQNDINALQGKLIEVGIDSGTYKDDLNTIQNAIDEMTGKALPIDINNQTQAPLSDIQTALDALKDANIEVTTNDIQTILDDLEKTKDDIEALNGSKAELEIGWKEENNKTQLEILQDSLANWQSSYSTYLNEIIDKLRTLIESQKQAGSYEVTGTGNSATYQSTYSYTPQIGDKVKFRSNVTTIPGTNNTVAGAFWYNGGNYALDVMETNGDQVLLGQGGTGWYWASASTIYKSGTTDPSLLSYSTNTSTSGSSGSTSSDGSGTTQQSSDNQQQGSSGQENQSSNSNQQSNENQSSSNFKVGDTVSYRDGAYTATITALYDDGNAEIDISGNKYYVGQDELTLISSSSNGGSSGQSSGDDQQQQNDTPANGASRETSNGWQYYDADTGRWENYVYKSDSEYAWYENPITGDKQDRTTLSSNPAPSTGGGGDSSSPGDGWTYSGGTYGGGSIWIDPGTGEGIYFAPGSFATGTLGTTTKTFMVNENGIEAMVTPDGTVISAPTPGYGVIKNEYTERLTDFAADPLQFLNKEFSGYIGNYKNNQNNNQVININGNLNLPNVTNGESFVDSIKTLALQYTTRRK